VHGNILQNGRTRLFLFSEFYAFLTIKLSQICHILSTVALRKMAAIPKEQLRKFNGILPILSICGMFFNASCFFQNYFTMMESKQIFNNIQNVNLMKSIQILLYTAEYLTKIGGYLFNMTSTLAWFDIGIR
jgi:hypothetical protein